MTDPQWTWTIEGIRRMVVAHVSNIHAREHDGIAHGNLERAETAERFDAALAAHDAEVRAKALEDAAEAVERECTADVYGYPGTIPCINCRGHANRLRARAEREAGR